MGVDIGTYRARIGTFAGNNGTDVVTFECYISFRKGLKTVGSVLFIGILLIIAGIEINPGPNVLDFILFGLTIFVLLIALLLQPYREEVPVGYQMMIYTVAIILSVTVWYRWKNGTEIKIAKHERKHEIIAIVRHSFTATNDTQLNLNEEDMITVIDTNTGQETWWKGELKGKIGLFPKDCVESLQEKPSEIHEMNTVDPAADEPSSCSEDYTAGDCSEVCRQSALSSHDKLIFDKVEELGLKKWFPGKLNMKTLMTIDASNNVLGTKKISLVDLPWIMLKRLLSLNSDSMDIRIPAGTGKATDMKSKGSLSALYDSGKEIDSISPLDLFIIVFQCCDPMLKQLLFQKLYLCKLAVPFIYRKFHSSESVVHIWPLRSIVIEVKIKTGRAENSVLDMQTNVLCFARFGRPRFSKSKLINGILSDSVTGTFYNRDCPSGTIPRHTDGYVEMFWLPTVGESKSRFDTSLSFLNMRGDMENSFSENICAVISDMSDILVAICETDVILNNSTKLIKAITTYSNVILLITNPLDSKDSNTREELCKFVNKYSRDSKTHLTILGTYRGDQERNLIDIITDVSGQISNHLKNQPKVQNSLESRLNKDGKVSLMSDENNICRNAEKDAKSIVETMTKSSKPENWVNAITPIQCMSRELSNLSKQQNNSKILSSNEQIRKNIKSVRKRQVQETTDTVKLFMKYLVQNANRPLVQRYFLGWLKYYFERKKRTVLPNLLEQNQLAWDHYRKLKEKGNASDLLHDQEMLIKQFEQQIAKASFGLENLFREVGHLYDAIICLGDIISTDVDLPSVTVIVSVISDLVSNGYVFELLDGNSFYMPIKWNRLLLHKVHWSIQEKKVLALSVLGVQSSGKSTLLNTMFGSQYVVSSGRCTKGINAQLIPLHANTRSKLNISFEYVLIIDTEGLRAPELSDRNYKRDNELSTIITGLGDTTILNIMGENTSEIRDILQITVHAFLRLTLVNERLDIRKRCIFIHQNVTDITACDKMKTGLQLLIRNLDSVTEDAAISEGISDITAFNHVIEFDTESHVWYLPNLWQGNPPMARVNRKYSEAAIDLRQNLLSEALKDKKHKSFKTVYDILLLTEDLWKGVLAEDFVFSFRNSLEKKAYIELEKKFKSELRDAENTIDQEVLQLTQNTFSLCDEQKSLHEAKQNVFSETSSLIANHMNMTLKTLHDFFEENNYTDTTIKWKTQTLIDIECYYKELGRKKVVEIDRLMEKREVDIMINLMRNSHEEELRRESIELANELRNKGFDAEETNRRFENIWEAFMQKSLSQDTLQKTEVPLISIFIACLQNMFNNQDSVIHTIHERYKKQHERLHMKCLSGSFTYTKIDKNDISPKSKIKEYAKQILHRSETSLKISCDMLENLFINIDNKVKSLCKKDKEIESRDIKIFMQEVEELMGEIEKLNANSFSFKITFKVKAFIHISYFACSKFEAENRRYQNSHGVKARLDKYKRQVKDRFNAHLDERKSEDTAALLFRHAIKDVVRDRVQETLSIKIKAHLREKLPTLKYHLIVEILTDLVKKKSFKTFISYILSPRSYAVQWLTKEAEDVLFKSRPIAYFTIASEEVCTCLTDIKRCTSQSVKKFENSVPSIEEWVQHFTSILKSVKLPKECFRDVVRELDRIESIHIVNFKDKLLENLTSTENELIKEFKTIQQEDVRWIGSNPIVEISEDIWGCPDICVICREPCIRGNIHTSNHTCLQHRPSGCRGCRLKNKDTICLETCNFDVASDQKGNCAYFDFLCNPGERQECKETSHPIREYRKFIPNWDIEPTTDIDDKSKFWMWFIGEYKQDLAEYFKLIVTNVPRSWDDISEEEALESLRTLYARGDRRGN